MHHKIPKVALLDNHDSFIHNIVHEVAVCNCEWRLFLHDQTSVNDILDYEPTHIILGPVRSPQDAHVMIGLIKETAHRIPLLESVLDTKHSECSLEPSWDMPKQFVMENRTPLPIQVPISLQIYPLQHKLSLSLLTHSFSSRKPWSPWLRVLMTRYKHSNIRGYLYLECSSIPRVFYRVN